MSKIIHYCWFGGSEKPPIVKKCIDSWKEYFPDFEIMEWNEQNFDIHNNRYVEEAYQSKKYAFVSDVARFYALEKFGGLYFDTDVEVIKDFAPLLDQEAFAGFETDEYINPGLVLWVKEKNNRLMKEMLNYYEGLSFIREDGSFNTTTICIYFTEILKQYGYLKFAGQKENKKGKMIDTLWANWDNMVEQIKKEIPMSDHPSKDFIAQYKKALNSVVSSNRTCITPVSGEYGSDGNKVYIEGKTWGQAFKKGFLEGLLVYPVAWVSHQLTQGFLNANVRAGWAQLLAILFTTIIIRGLLMLLTFKTTMDQQKMTALQPELAKIQAKYPNSNTNQYEKQRMAEEQMKLYKKYKIKPLNQILAMILQFFIFVAVWGALSGSSILTSGDIYGMHLSASIGSFITKFDFSSAWWTSLILFILMSGTQIVSTKLPQWMQKKNTKNVEKLGKNPAQDAQTKQMKYMTNFMMIMIIVMGFSLPSGMGLYWLFGAIISMIQTVITQSILKRKKMK